MHSYPKTLLEVNNASRYQICGWHRFLPSPVTHRQKLMLDRIEKRLRELGGFTPKISKALSV